MTPEISRGLATIADSPYWRVGGDQSSRTMAEWIEKHQSKKELMPEAKEALKRAEESYKEPWRWARVFGMEVLPVVPLPPEDRYIVGEVPGGITLVAVAFGAGNPDELYVAAVDDPKLIFPAVTVDSYAAQSQAPIKWKKRPNG